MPHSYKQKSTNIKLPSNYKYLQVENYKLIGRLKIILKREDIM